jgi:hypothetical protein
MSRITDFDTADIRFETSLSLDGSDAMNPDPDYSAAYVEISTDADDGLSGHAFAFTIGRGNDVQVAAIDSLRERSVGATPTSCSPTWARRGASSSTTPSCAGSACARPCSTWRCSTSWRCPRPRRGA